jgi:hypothetical protein
MIHQLSDIEFILTKHYPSADHDILDEIVNTRYRQCLRAGGYVWSRLEINDFPLLMTPAYITGTVSVTNGQTLLQGDGTNAWTSAQDKLSVRVAGRDEFYTFNFLNANQANLDHGYEGPTATGLSYSIFKRIYTLPPDAQDVQNMKILQINQRVYKVTRADLDVLSPSRIEVSYPRVYAPYNDTSDGLPQIEIYPTPNTALGSIGLTMDYKTVKPELRQPTDPIPNWFPWDALLMGCKVDLSQQSTAVTNRTTGIWAARQEQVSEQKFQAILDAAISEDINSKPTQQMRMEERINMHRRLRQYSDRDYHWWELHISNQ